MEFVDEALDELRGKSKKMVPLSEVILPEASDVFFYAKQKELIAQYQGARMFLSQTATTYWDYWFTKTEPEDECTKKIIKNNYRAYFYETALLYYNIVVDLSWVMLYAAVEYRWKVDGTAMNISGIQSIGNAYNALRDIESATESPVDAHTNAFRYLKQVYPTCANAVDLITEFWKENHDSTVRNLYNFCKHRGKPLYKEIKELQGGSPFTIRIAKEPIRNDNSAADRLAFMDYDYVEIVSDTHDVQKEVSLTDEIERLRVFDNETLYPYIKELLKEIERIIKPSPLVIS